MNNMPVVTNEVKLMLGLRRSTPSAPAAPGRFGAKDINDLNWNNLLRLTPAQNADGVPQNVPPILPGKNYLPEKS